MSDRQQVTPPSRFAERMELVRPSAIRDLLRFGADPELISFGGGYPDPDLFPMAELREVFDGLLSGGSSVLQYTVSDGIPRLREQVAERMTRDGVACTPGRPDPPGRAAGPRPRRAG